MANKNMLDALQRTRSNGLENELYNSCSDASRLVFNFANMPVPALFFSEL